MHFPSSKTFRAHVVLSALSALPFVFAASVTERSLEVRAAPTCSTANPFYTHYNYLGCAHDSAKRALTGYYEHAAGNDIFPPDICTLTCGLAGIPIAGIETGTECYCGTSFENGQGYSIPESSCSVEIGPAPGYYQSAGGSWALSIYVASRHSVDISSPDCVIPAGWQPDSYLGPQGCYHDGPNRALTGYTFKSDQMTYQLCTNTCASKGFKLAGIEVGSECYCGNDFENGEGYKIDDSVCNQRASGSSDIGGGKWALSVYQASMISKPVDLHVTLPAAPKKRSLNFGRNATISS
ncbi:G- protein-coupled receptor [Steccherinum ochraceum]|uniref:G-protein-coupled receptor n=1 Tax=Steccherinum ochraceum TaxID=92696 RepID=A0A4R0R367_9APHY|nr:G- protein-coupled receptor [Steccherinum ochraceum]